jgi:hypothetical protein
MQKIIKNKSEEPIREPIPFLHYILITYKFSVYTNYNLYLKKLKYFLPTLLKAY